jgi:dihydropteroate synthase
MTTFSGNRVISSLNCGGQLLLLDPPVVMGILNLTPDSFFDGGKFTQDSEIQRRVENMLADGATIIDIGGVSTRPGADPVSPETEWDRIKTVLGNLRRQFPQAYFSVDTTSAMVAEKAIDMGTDIINDVSGGDADPGMFELISKKQVPYVLMHMQGTPATMQKSPEYKDVTAEVLATLINKAKRLQSMGCKDIILDPGFGFGKDTGHNYQLLADLNLFAASGYPVLAGFSRKSMINRVLGTSPENALNGTTVLNTIALMKGCSILRVHDVKEAVEAIKLVSQMKSSYR